MGSFDCIVVGVDGSPSSAAALDWVDRQLAEDGGLHVVHAFSPGTELLLAAMRVDWVPLRAQAQQNLDGPWTHPLRESDRSFETHLVEDDPADALLRTASRYRADLIAVGAHGTPIPHGHLLGGVTKKLLHHTQIPVVVVHADTPSPHDRTRPIVACVGYGRAGDAAALWGASVAATGHRPLTLLHALSNRPFYPKDSPLETLSSHLGADVAIEWVQENLDRLGAEIRRRHPDIIMSTTIAKGSATDAIMAAGEDAELVVLGNGLAGIIGPRTQHVLTFGQFASAVVPTCETSP